MRRNRIIIGWSVNEAFEPTACTSPNYANLSNFTPEHLVQIDPKKIGAHSCILAQSGSGRSYFLGRLLEELLLTTKAKLLILDPNAEFLRFYDVVADSSYSPIYYDRRSRLGHLPTESSTVEFRDFLHSSNNSFCIVTNHIPPQETPSNVTLHKYRIPFGQLGNSFYFDGRLSYQEARDLALCHEFVESVLIVKVIARDRTKFKTSNSFKFDTDWKRAESSVALSSERLRKKLLRIAGHVIADERVKWGISNACKICDHVTPDSWRFYDKVLNRYLADNFLDKVAYFNRSQHRVRILDGTSTESREYRAFMSAHALQRTIISAHEARAEALEAPQNADLRVPTFVVIDEAHNLAPKGDCTDSEARCRELIREISAGGKKLGIFLILVSNRPEKLDPVVASEVDNLALMHLGNLQTLGRIIRLFGIDNGIKKDLEKVLQLPKGRALLLGEWTDGEPVCLMSAMRRTVESGYKLDPRYWASAPEYLIAN